jgi:hypothetical protein
LYAASLRTEEGNPIRVQVVIGADERSKDRVDAITKYGEPCDLWQTWPLFPAIEMTVEALTKIGRATDPRSSALAVEFVNGVPMILALVDLQERHHGMLIIDVDRDPHPRPGYLQATISGTGHIAAFSGYKWLAELRGAELLPKAQDVLSGGPVFEALGPSRIEVITEVSAWAALEGYEITDRIVADISKDCSEALSRVLLRMQSYQSGGALLVSPQPEDHLDIKYPVFYDRLNRALITLGRIRVQLAQAGSDPRAFAQTRSEALAELNGVTRYISLLTRVDGLVILDPQMTVSGFGAKIKANTVPPCVVAAGNRVQLATTRGATPKGMRFVPYDHYGTRHQSMFRYCQEVPGSVGLLVSQDGDARAVTQVNGCVTLWSNIRLIRDHRLPLGRPPAAR